jgi:F1F0 ATPase subunit 2
MKGRKVSELLKLFLAWTAGGLLGAFFFAGLLWTTGKGLSSKQPALWFLGSGLLRMSIAMTGFYFVSGCQFDRLVSCLLGFHMAGCAVAWLTRISKEDQIGQAKKVHHAP